MRKNILFIMCITIIILLIGGCKEKKHKAVIPIEECKNNNYNIVKDEIQNSNTFMEQKKYQIPSDQQKESYSVEDFKHLYSEYLKLNNFNEETSLENDKTEMSKEDQLKYYTIYDITPKEVKEEIGCQIFKVNYSCETYVVYNSKVFRIGFGFGGFGVVSLTTCDFDGNGQKDLIYTCSGGSGLHRSNTGVFNFSKEKEEWPGFGQLNKDIMLEKISDNNFKIYIADVSINSLDYIHLKLSKQELVADVQEVDGKIKVISNVSIGDTDKFDKVKSELALIPSKYNIDNAVKDGCFVIDNEYVKSKLDIIDKFVSDSKNGKSTSITTVLYTDNGEPIIIKIVYDGVRYYGIEDDTRDISANLKYRQFEFKYLKIFEEDNRKIYYLFNDNNITYNGFFLSLASSNSNDNIDHQFICEYKN